MSEPLTVTQFLHTAYRNIYDSLTACGQDESRSYDAPAFRMMEEVEPEGDAPATAQEVLLRIGGFMLASVGIRVRQHVGALALTYTSTDPGPHFDGQPFDAYQRWPGGAAFTIARSILEGVATACWLVEAAPDVGAFLRRISLLELWSSAHNDRAGEAPLLLTETKSLVQGAGFVVVHKKGAMPGLEVVGRPPERFHHTVAIRAVFGEDGAALYSQWSGRSHHALWSERGRLTATAQERASGAGMSFRSDMEEYAHVAVVANVAKMAARYIDDLATYYGRSSGAGELHNLATFLQEQARAALDERLREG